MRQITQIPDTIGGVFGAMGLNETPTKEASDAFEKLDKLLMPLDVALDRQQFIEIGKQLAYTEARLILMESGITALEVMKRIGELSLQSVRQENVLRGRIAAHDTELDAVFYSNDDPFVGVELA